MFVMNRDEHLLSNFAIFTRTLLLECPYGATLVTCIPLHYRIHVIHMLLPSMTNGLMYGVWIHLRVFFSILTKGVNFCDFLFASLGEERSPSKKKW